MPALAGGGAQAPLAAPSPTARRWVQQLGLMGRLLRNHERAWRRRAAGNVKLHHTSAAAASARGVDMHLLTNMDLVGWRKASGHSVTISGLGELMLRHARAALRQGSVMKPGDDHFCTLPCSICGNCPESGTRGGVTHISCSNCGADLPRDLASTTNEALRNVVFMREATDALLLRAVPTEM